MTMLIGEHQIVRFLSQEGFSEKVSKKHREGNRTPLMVFGCTDFDDVAHLHRVFTNHESTFVQVDILDAQPGSFTPSNPAVSQREDERFSVS